MQAWLLEKSLAEALEHSVSRAYVLESGRITRTGRSLELMKDVDILSAYPGM